MSSLLVTKLSNGAETDGASQSVSYHSHKKKVLLRERKRHTARRVVSARYAALSYGWGRSTPSSPGGGGGGVTPGTPHHPDLAGGHHPGLAGGHHPDLAGGGYPGYPHPDLGWGTPPPTDLGQGTPPCKCEQTENTTFPHRSDAGGKKIELRGCRVHRAWGRGVGCIMLRSCEDEGGRYIMSRSCLGGFGGDRSTLTSWLYPGPVCFEFFQTRKERHSGRRG